MSKLIAVVLAAGHGSRMKSELPKVLHPLCGRHLLEYPISTALSLGASQVVVVVNAATRTLVENALAKSFSPDRVVTALQEVPRGTGDAARAGLEGRRLDPKDRVLVMNGDVPLVESARLSQLLDQLSDEVHLSFLSFQTSDPSGYGRVLRDAAGRVCEIREEKDLRSDTERAVSEVNGGLYAAHAANLNSALAGLGSDNAQGEYYITDIVASVAESAMVTSVIAERAELVGINDRDQLRRVEELMHERIRKRLAQSGVSLVGRPLIDDTVEVEREVRIEDGVRLRGATRIGAGTLIDVGTVITDTIIGRNSTVKPYCVLSESQLGDSVQVGPFAHLRPGSRVEDECHLGNFVETKQTLMKRGAKANHLSYLGDAEIGERSNLGAGTIICNYDGFQKQRTKIGNEVFVGSDSQLIAPVEIGAGAYVATGTTVNQDVPAGALAIGRSRQTNKEGYASALRARLSEQAARAKKK